MTLKYKAHRTYLEILLALYCFPELFHISSNLMQLIYSEDSIPRGSEFQLVHAAYFVALNNDSYA